MINENLLKEIIRKNIDHEELKMSDITDSTLLMDNLLFDSISFIQLIVDIETAFNIEIDDLEINKYEKYSDLYNYLNQILEGGKNING